MTGTALTLHVHESEPSVLDTDLATRLGMARPRDIRANLIEPNRVELEGYGPLRVERTQTPGRTGLATYLNEEQALLIVMFSRTCKAAELRREIVAVFKAWRHGELAQPTPPVIPDFTSPAIAARAWAEQFEARQIADHRALEEAERATAAESKVDELVPLALVGKMVASRTLRLGDFLRQLPHVDLKQVQNRLVEMGVLYRSGKKVRVRRGPYGEHFYEGTADDWGGAKIFPTAKGKALLISFYRDNKLPMKAGHKPQSLPKALA